MELHLKFIGCILIALSMMHINFPKRFNWSEEFSRVSLLNRQMMFVHTLFIALVVFLIGVLCLTSAKELVQTDLGKRICFGIFIFWFARLVTQFFGYSSLLWKGKRYETTVHIVISILWVYLSAVFFLVAMR